MGLCPWQEEANRAALLYSQIPFWEKGSPQTAQRMTDLLSVCKPLELAGDREAS